MMFKPPQLPSLPPLPAFSSSRTIPISVPDLAPVAGDVMDHFRSQGYDVAGDETFSGGRQVSISKGSIFSAVLGLKTALNIEIEATSGGTMAKAGIGIFGRQVLPVLIARFVAWPVWVTQVWGLVQQARLDDEALDVVERSLRARATRVTPLERTAAAEATVYCTNCGARVPAGAKLCARCGEKVE